MLNSIIVMGRIVAVPEKRETSNGVSCTRFTIAVERNFVKQGEERQTDFFDIIAWRGTGELVLKYFGKGQLICIQGSMETRNYEDKNGVKRKAYTINAERVHFTGEKRRDTVSEENSGFIPVGGSDPNESDGDLPF